jgi:hypothetical protein
MDDCLGDIVKAGGRQSGSSRPITGHSLTRKWRIFSLMSKQPDQMFFVAVEVRHRESDNFEQAAGAVINSWLLANSKAEAESRARREIMEIGWAPTKDFTVTRVHREDYESNSSAMEYFDQAVLDGIVIVIHTWDRGDERIN